ncbi:serine/threonine protein kinase, negative regulator of sexual conjugation and meiosis [Cristinia sonorae]|uniref:Serine/threonine protein kinase, negative regulator of sexual conjugation and meiosis n=1 Tax=Cristinia sonorae TaxID=1940300 RepID=A0A8K0XKP6_9AGAR|nr:serine/threonine protein kinase, negative regulator of sexual conjugation and meiosis [Cristinia sonorae]
MPGRVASAVPDFTGRVVADGRYQFLRLLGTGAYGAVYQALDHTAQDSTTCLRAIKIIHTDSLREGEVSNLQREVAIHRIMSSDPNIVRFHHTFQDEEFFFIVLDFVAGGDLFTRICGSNMYFLDDDRIKQDFVQILDAVQSCHRKRIFHRDLKPENILCGENGKIYLADFGLATTRSTSTTFGCGSPAYMSPECIGVECDNEPYSSKANDVWGLGVILVNMIAARNPWSRAITDDDCFHDFIVDENFLLEMLPISKSANNLLKRIFQLEAIGRISIRDLREEILELDTFFMSEVEVKLAPKNVRIVWDELSNPRKSSSVRSHPRSTPRDDTPATSPITSPNATPRVSVVEPLPLGPGPLLRANTTSDSDESSEGPMTPERVATATVEIPEEQDLADITLLHEALASKLTFSPRPLRVINDSEIGSF